MKYICIHGHFYQPPRENPWSGSVEREGSAYPYHDWNQRITAECYAPNAASRILDHVVNNYADISFNFGPTLLSWLEANEPETYAAIINADHRSAMAQVYNHMIMPLCNRRDKITQVRWGIKAFELRFKRRPEGMWLAETAVDLETLDIMAGEGIKFTVLAPHQATEKVDPKIPYLCQLPSGKSITLFFYDGHLAQEVAFGGLLNNGEHFASRLLGLFSPHPDQAELVNVATDGETYGHHHRFGEMALSYAIYHIQKHNLARITTYGQFLENNPPRHEVKIVENSSWSCVHGVERWRADCGCSTGGQPAWNQAWRKPLRETLDWLRDELIVVYEREMAPLVKDPWAARDEYLGSSKKMDPKAHKLLEMQKFAMFMFTSCGWFFNDVSGLETIQIIRYAAKGLQLAREISGLDLEPEFLRRLEQVKSNVPEVGNAKQIYDKEVWPV